MFVFSVKHIFGQQSNYHKILRTTERTAKKSGTQAEQCP